MTTVRCVLTTGLIVAALAVGAVQAEPRVHFILGGDGPAYREVYGAARHATAGKLRSTLGELADPIPPDADIIVALGTAAARHMVESGEARPVFAALVPQQAWHSLVRDASAGGPRTALFLDQPIDRQLALVRVLLGSARDVGVIIGADADGPPAALVAAAARHDLRVVFAKAASREDLPEAMESVLRRSSVLLTLPDPEIYNRYTVQAMLLASFRLRRPVIGFSEAWVNAGALGAVYSSSEGIGVELAGMLVKWAGDGEVPPARLPAKYSVRVNRQVAFTLGLTLPVDEEIVRRVAVLERTP